jgi:acyl-coenzyme A synthetase/AMP-(fatty) acid ligase
MNNLAFKLIQNYKNNPDKICLVQGGSQITYKDLYDKVKEFKKYLLSKGIKKESKVLVLVPMSINLYVTLISLWTIGAVPCFMDAGFIKNGMKKNEFANVDGLIGITKYLLYSNITQSELTNLINRLTSYFGRTFSIA